MNKLHEAIEKSSEHVADTYRIFSKAMGFTGDTEGDILKLIKVDGVIALYTSRNIYMRTIDSNRVVVLPMNHNTIKTSHVVYP